MTQHLDPQEVLDAMLDNDIEWLDKMFAAVEISEIDAVELVKDIAALLSVDQPTLSDAVNRIYSRYVH